MSDSVFLEFTDLLRRGSLDLTDCREEEEMGDSVSDGFPSSDNSPSGRVAAGHGRW
jgi:hypothetical protein